MNTTLDRKLRPEFLLRIVGVAFFAYLFFGFMLLPCLNTLTSIFNVKNAAVSFIFSIIMIFILDLQNYTNSTNYAQTGKICHSKYMKLC